MKNGVHLYQKRGGREGFLIIVCLWTWFFQIIGYPNYLRLHCVNCCISLLSTSSVWIVLCFFNERTMDVGEYAIRNCYTGMSGMEVVRVFLLQKMSEVLHLMWRGSRSLHLHSVGNWQSVQSWVLEVSC